MISGAITPVDNIFYIVPSILISGANGFIGQHLVSYLQNKGIQPVLAVRNVEGYQVNISGLIVRHFDLNQVELNNDKLLKNIDVVIHLAGIAHKKSVSQAEFTHLNTLGTQRLALQAIHNGIKRFIFISTVKVHGESTTINEDDCFNEQSPLNPQDAYAKSKLAGEKLLKEACSGNGMDYVILRVPLIYGPGVKANFYNLLNLLSHNYPLPLSQVENLRSLLYVENLCDVIERLIQSPDCKNRVFLVKDYNLSTVDLVTSISTAFKNKPNFFHLPKKLIDPLARVFNQTSKIEKLFGSLVIDDALLRKELLWQPNIDFNIGINRTVEWYLNSK
jgi:UDP-glucose 4-epimerase